MKARFWGTRGSLAKPGPATVRYGGNTSCVEIVSAAGTRLVIDCGTGGHELGQAILREGAPSRGHMLISHTHWDHIQGIPFFAPFFVPGHDWTLYAPQGFGESLKDTLAGQMEYTYFPVTPEAFAAKVRYANLGEGVFTIDDLTIRTRYLNHPALTLAFRIEGDGATIVYACDHEPHAREMAMGDTADLAEGGADSAHAAFMADADLIIHDAQYLASEYAAKAGWGHSTIEYAVAIGGLAGAGRIALTHHDPGRSDDAIDAYLERLRAAAPAGGPEIIAAAEGMEIEVGSAVGSLGGGSASGDASAIRDGEVQGVPVVILLAQDDAIAERIERAVDAEPLVLVRVADVAGLEEAAARNPPALVLVETGITVVSPPLVPGSDRAVPLVTIGGRGDPAGEDAVDRLEEPWSTEYARTRIRTWLLRGECHWLRAPIPDDEVLRLSALHALALLDTPYEERFDRHTRLASALFQVPVALITLVDRERQWFKSCFGTTVCESSRETSFCAHAIAARAMLIVPDTLNDPRFRDNPLVTGEPHVRFYAGAPIHAPDGQPLGTLCLIDVRPRHLSDEQCLRLTDLAALVEEEIHRSAADSRVKTGFVTAA